MKHVQPQFLDVNILLPLLNKYLPMEKDDNYILMNPFVTPTERAMALLYIILPNKGKDAYGLFVRCLQEETQQPMHQALAQLLPKGKLTF